jgi:hypothetical protein
MNKQNKEEEEEKTENDKRSGQKKKRNLDIQGEKEDDDDGKGDVVSNWANCKKTFNEGKWRGMDMTAIVVGQQRRFKSAFGDGLMQGSSNRAKQANQERPMDRTKK